MKLRDDKTAKDLLDCWSFRKALEERLKQTALAEQIDINRLRRQVAFDRLLARLFQPAQPPWVLKGGHALELRLQAARSTVDVDLTMPRVELPSDVAGTANAFVREMLQNAAASGLEAWASIHAFFSEIPI
ncbi:MAG TPA: nucleotidyl transferase AbiEii/AbiGii toxin family protein [Bryobacteraceae bacterium]|nr:nucleotidyl transferase AbiEii/AbiGii toxin family protein [Bryobacteraceae bacterium]HTF71402.1 nucleotidyl transferase AbiEii/AbiGii toxin family protein [Edaphobacter sp.]